MVVEGIAVHKMPRVGSPNMDAGGQEDRLAIVHGIANVALFDDDDSPIAMRNVPTEWPDAMESMEHTVDKVHSWLGEIVLVRLILEETDVAAGRVEERERERERERLATVRGQSIVNKARRTLERRYRDKR